MYPPLTPSQHIPLNLHVALASRYALRSLPSWLSQRRVRPLCCRSPPLRSPGSQSAAKVQRRQVEHAPPRPVFSPTYAKKVKGEGAGEEVVLTMVGPEKSNTCSGLVSFLLRGRETR